MWRKTQVFTNVLARTLVTGILGFALTGAAHAAGTETQDAVHLAVRRLGELNGVALACGQGALAVRLREIVIETAPKERDIGESFEEATSAAFLKAGQAQAPCPDGRALAGEIDGAKAQLHLAVGGRQ